MDETKAYKLQRTLHKVEVALLDRRGRLLGLEEFTHILARGLKKMSQALDELKAVVARQTTLNNSVAELVSGLRTQLETAINSGDMGEVQKLVDELEVKQDELAAAVATNVPAPDPVPDPAPAPDPNA
jgi:hypothetical protein